MADRSEQVHAAMYVALAGKIDGAVYDGPPAPAAFPYTEIGDQTAVDDDTKGEFGQQHTVTLHVWSRDSGQMEAKRILNQIYELLHGTQAVVAGANAGEWRRVFQSVGRDQDGLTVHGVARYRVDTDEES